MIWGLVILMFYNYFYQLRWLFGGISHPTKKIPIPGKIPKNWESEDFRKNPQIFKNPQSPGSKSPNTRDKNPQILKKFPNPLDKNPRDGDLGSP